MDARQAVDQFDRMCEADTQHRLDHAERQRYGEVPVVKPKPSRNPWDPPSGSGDAIQQWRDSFKCLRCARARARASPDRRGGHRPRARPRRITGKNIWGDRFAASSSTATDDAYDADADAAPAPAGKYVALNDSGSFGDVSFIRTPRRAGSEGRPPAAPSSPETAAAAKSATRPLPQQLGKLPPFGSPTRGGAAPAAFDGWAESDDDDDGAAP